MKHVPLGMFQSINRVLYLMLRSMGIASINEESKKVLIVTTSVLSYLIIRKLIKVELSNENRDKEVHKARKRDVRVRRR
jgi:hypothetical protein